MYKYYVLYRPIGIGTVPNGFVEKINYEERQRVKDTTYKAFGEVYYEERLSEKEIYDYELKEEPTQEEKNKVLEDVKKLDDVYERIKDLKLNDERLEQKIEKVSEYINREICTQLNNNIISHKEYLNYIESITEEKEDETL